MSNRCIECGDTERELNVSHHNDTWVGCKGCGSAVWCDVCAEDADRLVDGVALCGACSAPKALESPKPVIPCVNQIWEVEDGKHVAIVAIQAESFKGPEVEVMLINGRAPGDDIVHVAYSDGMTGAYTGLLPLSKMHRLIWCPFGQHEETP